MTPPKDEGYPLPKIKTDPTLKPGEWRLEKDEAKMSNRERAKKMSLNIPGNWPDEKSQEIRISYIERALDEKDAEWISQLEYLRQFIPKADSLPKDFDIKKALDEAEKRGQKEMRERAAKEMDEVLDLRMDELVAAKRQIRALPIEGE